MVTIVDYGMGNLRSVENALQYLKVQCIIESRPEQIAVSKKLILPGVGSFARAMSNLRASGLQDALEHAVHNRGAPLLGICLGMQLLADTGNEDGSSNGLGWIAGDVVRLNASAGRKIPHIGFNAVHAKGDDGGLLSGLEMPIDFYFVHSYHFVPRNQESVVGECEYDGRIVAAVRKENVWGVQFHPEKSQGNGLQLLRNFSMVPSAA